MQETYKGVLDDYTLLAKQNEQKVKYIYEQIQEL